MTDIEGLETLTIAYLGREWQLFGSTIEDAIARFAREQPAEQVAAAATGLEGLRDASWGEDEMADLWIMKLRSGYDPHDHGYATYRDWFAHALKVLQSASTETID